MIFDNDLETLPREELEALQLRRLKQLVEKVYHNVPFYRRKFDEAGLTYERELGAGQALRLMAYAGQREMM